MQTPETAYLDFRGKLQSYLARRLGNPHDVEDVLQDVFLRVARHQHTLETAREPLAWLYTVTNSAIVDHIRKRRKDPLANADGQILDIPFLPDEDVGSDFSDCLYPLVENLPEKYRDAVRFVDLNDGKQTELAKMNSLSVSAAKSRVQRGRKLLKDAILGCCQVERDGLQNVTSLGHGECDKDCC